jgi:hypothetical protein
VLNPPFSCKIYQYLCAVEALYWSQISLCNMGTIQALYLFFVPKIWCRLQQRCCVNIMLCSLLRNYFIHTTWRCCSQRLIFTTNEKLAKCVKQTAPPRGHGVSSSMTMETYLILVYLRDDWNDSPARTSVRMCNCANGHGVSDIDKYGQCANKHEKNTHDRIRPSWNNLQTYTRHT